ncbi:hypothetical protein [Amaricoccus tamworthensis]|uniref:hypothetical protein n=1 Tax=Amaricoccus tamworthensis TaxID=57002 RepID=UPI003C7D99E1
MEVSNGVLRLRTAPEFGARITELTDLRSGRNWIVPGDLKGSAAEGASYIEERPSGWDECFPTVAACEMHAWGGGLRDHGALWGRAWTCNAKSSGIVATYEDPRFVFRRSLRLAGEYVILRYSLTERQSSPLPWLWSQHCLLACRPGERIVASGIGPWHDSAGKEVSPGPVLPASAGGAGKFFAPVEGRASVAFAGDGGLIEFTWDAASAPWVGLWFSYGGWPLDNPLYQIGIEPTSAPFNPLSEAVKRGGADWLETGETRHWQCRIRIII